MHMRTITWWSAPAAIFADYVDLVANIGFVKFAYCPREAIVVADELAKDSLHE